MIDRRNFLQLTLAGAAAGLVLPRVGFAQVDSVKHAWEVEMPKILARIKPPKFKKKDYVITKYGAKEGGTELCTDAFKKAIDACNKGGGGRVVVPKGVWLSGAIHLKSNVNLHVSEGATIKFSTDGKDYLPVVRTRWEGMDLMGHSALIYAYEQTNIAVTGKGTLDGQGKIGFWKWHGSANYGGGGHKPGTISQRADRAKLYEYMDKNTPIEQRIFGEGTYLRMNFMTPFKCKNVLIEDCFFDTGDDCIAIKSGRNDDGRRANVPTENVIVRGCTMKDGHGGVTIGSEISGGVRNLFVENCKMDSPDLWYALRVKNNAQRGGVLENFYFRNITVGEVTYAVITVDFNYEEGTKGGHIPVMRNFVVENLTSVKSKYVVDIQGLANAPVYNVVLTNCKFDNVEDGNIVAKLDGQKLTNVTMNGKPLTALTHTSSKKAKTPG